jgi:hypothetical protein
MMKWMEIKIWMRMTRIRLQAMLITTIRLTISPMMSKILKETGGKSLLIRLEERTSFLNPWKNQCLQTVILLFAAWLKTSSISLCH